jgi:hypothetical protein
MSAAVRSMTGEAATDLSRPDGIECKAASVAGGRAAHGEPVMVPPDDGGGGGGGDGGGQQYPVLVAQAQRRAKELERELAAREAAHGCTVARLEAKLAKSVAEVHGGSEQRLAMQAREVAALNEIVEGLRAKHRWRPLRPFWRPF